MVDTRALRGLLYHDLGAYVCTVVVLGNPIYIPLSGTISTPRLPLKGKRKSTEENATRACVGRGTRL